MSTLDKAFLEAYRRQGVSAARLMPLSDAMELTRLHEQDDAGNGPSVMDSTDIAIATGESYGMFEPPHTPAPNCTMLEDGIAPGGKAVGDEAVAERIGKPLYQERSQDLRASLQVNAFVWPKLLKKLAKSAGDQMQHLAERVAAEAESGRNVIGFVGDCTSSGCTTLLMAVAKHLAVEMSVVVVDANLNNPSLARDLGLLPDVGWKNVAVDRLPLSEAMIDSLDDRLTVLPYSGHQELEPQYNPDQIGDTENFRSLALHYDLVLIDLGTLPICADDNPMLGCLDSAVIVRPARTYASRGVDQILRSRDVNIVGIAENRHRGSNEKPKQLRDAA